MGYSKEKKDRKRKKASTGLASTLNSFWTEKRPVLIFVFGFIGLMALFYAFWFSSFYAGNIHPKIVGLNAIISSKLLNLLGQHTVSQGDTVSSSVFSISVKKGCDAVEAMALFTSAVLAFPMSWKVKLRGLLIGILLLFTLNFIRIVSLYLTGVYYPEAFETMHIEVWQVLFIIFSLGLWIFVIRQDHKPRVDVKS